MRHGELLRTALYYLCVPKCVHCRKKLAFDEDVFCRECREEFAKEIDRQCSICAKHISKCTCSTRELQSKGIKQVIKSYRYLRRDEITAANSLIFSLKRDGRRDVLSFCRNLLINALENTDINLSNCVFVHIPRRHSQIIKVGFDHSKQLCSAVAKHFSAECIPLLRSRSKKPQKSLTKEERKKNVSFKLRRKPELRGKTVILVDDIITTGSSMLEAARLVRELGAGRIIACALAIAYKDTHESFDYVFEDDFYH